MLQKRTVLEVVIAGLVPYLIVGLFSDKAYHIDDPAYIWTARQIIHSPLDFYGFEINWGSTDVMMYEANKNPPGVSYFIALGALMFGWAERAQHLWMGLWASALGVAIHLLARRLRTSGVWSMLAAFSMPVVAVSATTVMADMQTLALYTASVVSWIYGLDRKSHPLLAVAGFLAAAAILTKYFGASLLPLLLAYGLMRERRIGMWCLHLLIPTAIFAAYLLWARYLYGLNPLSEAAQYAAKTAADDLARPLIGVAFTGACLATVMFYVPLLWRRRTLALGAVPGITGFFTIAYYDDYFFYRAASSNAQAFQFAAHYALFLLAGITVLSLCVTDARRTRDADSGLLVLWLLGTFAFSTFLNWSITARTILPMAVPAAILLSRHLDQNRAVSQPWFQRCRWGLMVPAFALALWVSYGDYAAAYLARRAAYDVQRQNGSHAGKYWFMGHWGYQYYLEESGLRYLTPDAKAELAAGDRVAIFRWLTLDSMTFDPTTMFRVPDAEISIANPVGISTHHPLTRSGFYTSMLGPLPFTIGPAPRVVVDVLEYQP
jgi:4-amino-4-deoxy-L-arabinose transferase-like glycosyltransferase